MERKLNRVDGQIICTVQKNVLYNYYTIQKQIYIIELC